jgi:hypothetical protein
MPRHLRMAVWALSGVAAAIHLWVAAEHFEEWWGYGAFFVVAAYLELAFAWLLIRRPSDRLILAGIYGSTATVLMYVVSRTCGVPLGPSAGAVEAVEAFGVTATAAEAALVVLLSGMLSSRPRRRALNGLAVVGVAVWAASFGGLLTPSPDALARGLAHHHSHGDESAAVGPHGHRNGEGVLPSIPDSVRNAPR